MATTLSSLPAASEVVYVTARGAHYAIGYRHHGTMQEITVPREEALDGE